MPRRCFFALPEAFLRTLLTPCCPFALTDAYCLSPLFPVMDVNRLLSSFSSILYACYLSSSCACCGTTFLPLVSVTDTNRLLLFSPSCVPVAFYLLMLVADVNRLLFFSPSCVPAAFPLVPVVDAYRLLASLTHRGWLPSFRPSCSSRMPAVPFCSFLTVADVCAFVPLFFCSSDFCHILPLFICHRYLRFPAFLTRADIRSLFVILFSFADSLRSIALLLPATFGFCSSRLFFCRAPSFARQGYFPAPCFVFLRRRSG